MKCPACKQTVTADHFICSIGARGGSVTSDKKARAARRNGKKGGRPKKEPAARANARKPRKTDE